MGKVSSILILLLMINLIGYILLVDYVDAYPTAQTSKEQLLQDNPLLGLYTSRTDTSGNTTYDITSNSSIYGGTTFTTPPDSYLSGVATFIDRIFIMFGWIRAVIGIAAFPVTLLSILGLPWQLSMLLGVPLATLYILGIIDIFSSSGT